LLYEDLLAEEEHLLQALFQLILITKHKLRHKRKWIAKIKSRKRRPVHVLKGIEKKSRGTSPGPQQIGPYARWQVLIQTLFATSYKSLLHSSNRIIVWSIFWGQIGLWSSFCTFFVITLPFESWEPSLRCLHRQPGGLCIPWCLLCMELRPDTNTKMGWCSNWVRWCTSVLNRLHSSPT